MTTTNTVRNGIDVDQLVANQIPVETTLEVL